MISHQWIREEKAWLKFEDAANKAFDTFRMYNEAINPKPRRKSMKRNRQWYSVVTVVNCLEGMEIVATDYCGSQPKAMDLLQDHSYNLPPKKGFSSMIVPLVEKPKVVKVRKIRNGAWDQDYYVRVA